MQERIEINGEGTNLNIDKIMGLIKDTEIDELKYLIDKWERRKESSDNIIHNIFAIELLEALVFIHAPKHITKNGKIIEQRLNFVDIE